MDPILPLGSGQLPGLSSQPIGNAIFVPGIFDSLDEESDYLSSLDSDTRDYVIKHTSEFRTRADIIECVDRLHG